MTIERITLKKDEICDKCSLELKQHSIVLKNVEKNAYKHDGVCPGDFRPNRNTRPKGLDILKVVEVFSVMTEHLAKTNIDLLKYEEDELVKFFWLYKNYLKEKDKEIPF
jgi:hypothetical protein